jgi:hypothetical protein
MSATQLFLEELGKLPLHYQPGSTSHPQTLSRARQDPCGAGDCGLSDELTSYGSAFNATINPERHALCSPSGRRVEMLYILAVILLIAWLLGMVGTYTVGAFIHVLLVIALVLFLVGLLSGRRTVI